MIERFYDPCTGEVRVNCENLTNVNLREYRNRIGYVGQEPCLFNESIRDNLLNSNPHATEAEIIEALKNSNAWDFVKRLPKGIDTSVGAVGGKLSGGQKQRIAIARALVRKPDLLIFDEATSALDNESEKRVQAAIDNINTEGITKVVIAHRLTTIKDSEKIIVLDQGSIIEEGDHDHLMQMKGVYYDLTNIQQIAENSQAFKGTGHKVDKQEAQEEDGEEQGENFGEDARLTEGSLEEISGILDEEEEQKYEEDDMTLGTVLARIYHYTDPKYLVPLIFIFSVFVAAAVPLLAYPQARLFIRFFNNEPNDIKNGLATYLPIMVGIGCIAFLFQFWARTWLFMINSNMIQKVRSVIYDKLIHQPMEFFDEKNHSVGNLTTILASNIREINGASTEMYVFGFCSVTGMITGVIMIFMYEWNLGLYAAAFVPLNALSVAATFAYQFGANSGARDSERRQEQMVSDYVGNYSTVASLANEDIIIKRYYASEEGNQLTYTLTPGAFREAVKPAFFSGLGVSFNVFSFFILLLITQANVRNGHAAFSQILPMFAFAYATAPCTFLIINSPDFGRSFMAARKILKIEEKVREGHYDSPIQDGTEELTPEIASGDIEFHNIWFRYPTADKDMWVLRNFNLKIRAGESVGLAGESGCGKSTVTALLYRFYEPQEGFISIGGRPISEFTLKSLRGQLGLVQQEPIVFDRTIMDNIIYKRRHATVDEIQDAANIANCKTFIEDRAFEGTEETTENSEEHNTDLRYERLPEGYKAMCGSRGSRLSGGQKQRVAIARAVIGSPKMLILDEATSALDENSQKIVQEALDQVMMKCTSIVIAHRLTTLSKCDRIVRLERGVIVNDSRN